VLDHFQAGRNEFQLFVADLSDPLPCLITAVAAFFGLRQVMFYPFPGQMIGQLVAAAATTTMCGNRRGRRFIVLGIGCFLRSLGFIKQAHLIGGDLFRTGAKPLSQQPLDEMFELLDFPLLFPHGLTQLVNHIVTGLDVVRQ
tara:strand:- start:614 stop:1039 length:426 start_codon:yes stop_codon:yes gene_type:complete